jgi:hypothetical protein
MNLNRFMCRFETKKLLKTQTIIFKCIQIMFYVKFVWQIVPIVVLIGNIIIKIIRSIVWIFMNLRAFMRPNMMKNSNLFNQQDSINLNYVLCKISIIDYSYRNIHWKIL